MFEHTAPLRAVFCPATSAKSHEILLRPIILGAPSVATDTRWVVFISLSLRQFNKASQMSSPVFSLLVVSTESFLNVAPQSSQTGRTVQFVLYHRQLSRPQLN